jgi:hypothetical protein
MTIETLEQAAQAQQQIEDFARLARDAKIAVEQLADAFTELADWPEDIGAAMPELIAAANDIADGAWDWAKEGDCEFDPSAPRSNQ